MHFGSSHILLEPTDASYKIATPDVVSISFEQLNQDVQPHDNNNNSDRAAYATGDPIVSFIFAHLI